MARDFDPYWRIFAQEVPSDLGIKLDDEQIDSLTRALEGAHENYGLHSGRDVADANWRAAHDREVEQRGIDKVMRFVQERIDIINSGSSTMFDVMNHRQKMALAEIFQIRELCK
jgi:hypothetical protein